MKEQPGWLLLGAALHRGAARDGAGGAIAHGLFWRRHRRLLVKVSVSRTRGEKHRGGAQNMHVQSMTRAWRAALLPVWALPSSFRIFLRSLLMSLFERSVMVAAVCCSVASMLGIRVRVRGQADGFWCRGRQGQAGLGI